MTMMSMDVYKSMMYIYIYIYSTDYRSMGIAGYQSCLTYATFDIHKPGKAHLSATHLPSSFEPFSPSTRELGILETPLEAHGNSQQVTFNRNGNGLGPANAPGVLFHLQPAVRPYGPAPEVL